MKLKTASFTVRATMAQSVAWKRAADGEGHASVGTWLAEAADRHLDAVKRSGKPLSLAWRKARFYVRLLDGSEVEVSGKLSPPFGVYWGTEEGRRRGGASCTRSSTSPRGALWGRSAPPPTAGPWLPSWRASGCVGEGASPPKIPRRFSSGSSGRMCRMRPAPPGAGYLEH